MLYLPPGTATPERVHGAFVDDHEVHHVVSWLKSQGAPNYIEGVLEEAQPTSDGKFINDAGLPQDGDEGGDADAQLNDRSEEHTSELQSLMRISYAVFCLKKKKLQRRVIHNSDDLTHQDNTQR